MNPTAIVVTLAAALLGTAGPLRGQSPDTPAQAADSTRLFIMPTGRTLAQGSGYLEMIGLGVAQFQTAMGDWVSMGAGTPSLVFTGARPVWLTPKVALARSARVNAAAGTIHYFAPGGGSGGFAYAAVSINQQATSVTVGVMQGYGDIPSEARVVCLGFERRRSEHTRVLFEAEIFQNGALVVAGVRRVHKRFTSDFGLAVPLSSDFGGPLIAFPVISFGWRF